jgi:4-hydroxybenzoate polyprenyltransferase
LLLIHYWLPLALGWSLAMVMQRSTGAALSPTGMLLLLAGIGAAYSFDRLIDQPKEPSPGCSRPRWVQRSLSVAAAVFAGATLFAASKMPPHVIGIAALLAATSLLYPRLKRLPLIKTVAVALAWTWASAALPLAGRERLAWTWWSLDVSLPLVLLLCAGCILCDLKDAHQDREKQVPSLPVLIGPRGTCFVATVLSLIAAALALANGRTGLSITSLALVLAAQFPALLARESIGPIVVDAILVIPGILIISGLI